MCIRDRLMGSLNPGDELAKDETQQPEQLGQEYAWAPYNQWDAMDHDGENPEMAEQRERQAALEAALAPSDSPAKPWERRSAEEQEQELSNEEFARQVELLKKMAAESRMAEQAAQQPGERSPEAKVHPEKNVGAGGDKDQVPQDSKEPRGVSLEPLADMLASMSFEMEHEGDQEEAAAIKKLETEARDKHQQVAEQALSADLQESWHNELRAHDIFDGNPDKSNEEEEAAVPVMEQRADADLELQLEAAMAEEDFFDIGDADPHQVVEALSQLYRSAGVIDTEASEIIDE
eukprot:TRINITY_DN20693_c0_g1_i2.p1 TRINITY_DN20693_c0_g1~~TRINITY_DN20693_c0_g1_i2.p1  ORF type:complete len:291 (-),score=102.29 TRINITY_DN20693_c0_g1_i2:594-1466(-)